LKCMKCLIAGFDHEIYKTRFPSNIGCGPISPMKDEKKKTTHPNNETTLLL